MTWLRDQVWLYGVTIVLILVGAVLLYVGGTDGESPVLLWAGLLLVFAAMTIPLAEKAYTLARGEADDEN